jgi:hypothetical protein
MPLLSFGHTSWLFRGKRKTGANQKSAVKEVEKAFSKKGKLVRAKRRPPHENGGHVSTKRE